MPTKVYLEKPEVFLEKMYTNGNISAESVIQDVEVGRTKEGIIVLHFHTRDKYCRVWANMSTTDKVFIEIRPYLYTDHGEELDDTEDEYYNHRDYYMVRLCIDTKTHLSYSSVQVALKHEYFISYAPDHMIMNYECLKY